MLRATVLEITEQEVTLSHEGASFRLPAQAFDPMPTIGDTVILQGLAVSKEIASSSTPPVAAALLRELLAS